MLCRFLFISAVVAAITYSSLCMVMHGKVFVPWEDAEGNVVPIQAWWGALEMPLDFNRDPTPPPQPSPPVMSQ